MKKIFLLITLVGLTTFSFSQKKRITTSATIAFDASTLLDPFPKAVNKTTVASFNPSTGEVAFETVIKNFTFSNPKIQGYFNSAVWMDSDNFPTASFNGTVKNLSEIILTVDGTYSAKISGELTLHGVTNPFKITATIVVSGKTINANSAFEIKVADYGINGSVIGTGKGSTDPKITVDATFN